MKEQAICSAPKIGRAGDQEANTVPFLCHRANARENFRRMSMANEAELSGICRQNSGQRRHLTPDSSNRGRRFFCAPPSNPRLPETFRVADLFSQGLQRRTFRSFSPVSGPRGRRTPFCPGTAIRADTESMGLGLRLKGVLVRTAGGI